MRRTLAVLVAVMLVGLSVPAFAGPPDQSEGANRVSGLEVEQKTDGTYLRLQSTETPSFSVFKLKQPLRLVVDVSNSQLGIEDGLRKVDDGVISQVSLLEADEEGDARVRLIVGFENPTHYDVRTEDNDVLIFVEGEPTERKTTRQRAELEEKEQKLAKTRDSYEDAQSELDSARDRLDQARSEVERLKEKLKNTNKGADRKKLKAKIEEKTSTAETLRKQLDATKQQRDEAQKRLSRVKEQLSEQRSRMKRQARKLEELREARSSWSDKLEEREQKYDKAVDDLEQTEDRLKQARREIERLRQQRNEAEGEAREQLEEKLNEKSQTLASMEQKLEDRRQTVENLQGEVQRLKRERTEAKKEIAELKEEFGERLEKSKAKYKRAADNLEQTRSRLEKARSEIESLRKQRESASGEDREKLESELADKQEALAAMEKRLNERESTADELRAKIDRLEEQKSDWSEKVEEYRQRLSQRDDKISKLQNRVENLEQKSESNEERSEKLANLKSKLQAQQEKLEKLKDKRDEQQRSDETLARGPAQAVPLTGTSRDDDAASNASEDGDKPNAVRDIRLETDGGESRIVVELERPGEYKRLPYKESRAVMLLNNVDLPERLEQTLAAGGDSGAVRFVSSYTEDDGQVRMEAELDSEADEKIRQEGNKLVWEFAPDAVGRTAGKTTSAQRDEPERPEQGTSQTAAPPNYPRTVTNPAEVDSVPGMNRKQLTIDLRDADVQNVLRLFSKEGGVNIIAGDGVSGSITLRLRSVPLDEAFLIVLQSLELGFEVRGNVIRVAPQADLLEEQQKRREAQKKQQRTRPLEVFLMPVNYAKADKLTGKVEGLLSPRGSVSTDERTNTLIIKDLPENIRSVRELVGALDAQVPQVLIEARIVETNDTFSQEFGIQWGGDFSFSQGGGNPTGLAFPNVLGVGGGATDGQTPTQGTSSNPNFAVNLPAPAGTGAGGALGLTMGNVSGSVNLNLRLSAAEETGRAKIISAPKILTLDNREATISQGTSIPISVVSAAGVQTVFVDATLELTVTPHVTPDGNVQLQVEATKNEPDFQNTGAQGDPTIIRKQAETELLIEDGETTVIGGIYTRNSGSSITGIPLLHRIPILGLLFKQKTRSERRTELLIFLTPRVVNRAESLGDMSAGNVVEPGAAGSGGEGGGQ